MADLPLIAPPAAGLSDAERDLACRDMLDPYLGALANAAINEGWHPAEVAAAMLGHAVDAIRAGAGLPAAVETLNDALALLRGHQAN